MIYTLLLHKTVTPAQAGVYASERVVYAVMQNMFQTPRHGFQPSLERRSVECYNHISKHKTVTPSNAGVYAYVLLSCVFLKTDDRRKTRIQRH